MRKAKACSKVVSLVDSETIDFCFGSGEAKVACFNGDHLQSHPVPGYSTSYFFTWRFASWPTTSQIAQPQTTSQVQLPHGSRRLTRSNASRAPSRNSSQPQDEDVDENCELDDDLIAECEVGIAGQVGFLTVSIPMAKSAGKQSAGTSKDVPALVANVGTRKDIPTLAKSVGIGLSRWSTTSALSKRWYRAHRAIAALCDTSANAFGRWQIPNFL
ncbi:hypothetical protein RHSIM_Rhsim04G0178200 [Rhododendron simsii]|uniref:Uncharacterized protein n=1 Tax=Rhododendron simsii TaxID=118357 RepID=A0A834H442_RHOSS|nr:hypothetical protein RHSIM_Rhsim04G0178200 [Rhododendron simsii]